MTVAQPIEKLSDPRISPDAIVVMAKDREGNDYSPADEVDTGAYLAETTWSGTVGEAGWDDDAVDCVVLWPVN